MYYFISVLITLLGSFVTIKQLIFCLFHVYSTIHGPGRSLDLTGTILSFHHSIPEAVNGGMVSGGRSCQQLFLGMADN